MKSPLLLTKFIGSIVPLNGLFLDTTIIDMISRRNAQGVI
jgi:hypothetical protein